MISVCCSKPSGRETLTVENYILLRSHNDGILYINTRSYRRLLLNEKLQTVLGAGLRQLELPNN